MRKNQNNTVERVQPALKATDGLKAWTNSALLDLGAAEAQLITQQIDADLDSSTTDVVREIKSIQTTAYWKMAVAVISPIWLPSLPQLRIALTRIYQPDAAEESNAKLNSVEHNNQIKNGPTDCIVTVSWLSAITTEHVEDITYKEGEGICGHCGGQHQ